MFVAISGASSTFSHNNVRRGIKLLLCALVVSLATYVAMPSEFIRFGILHFLGCAALLYALLRPLLEKVPLHPLAFLLLFFLFRWLLSPTYDIPHLWWLGIRQPSFSSLGLLPPAALVFHVSVRGVAGPGLRPLKSCPPGFTACAALFWRKWDPTPCGSICCTSPCAWA